VATTWAAVALMGTLVISTRGGHDVGGVEGRETQGAVEQGRVMRLQQPNLGGVPHQKGELVSGAG
jgi:hypothetical protein